MWNWILQNGLAVLGLGGYAVVGLLAALGYFRKNDTRQKESDQVADTLIDRLQGRVKQLEEDMQTNTQKRDEQIKTLTSQVDHLSGRNGMLEDLFKGRDPGMQNFLKDAPGLVTIARENNSLARENAQNLNHLTDTLAKFINTLQPILIHIEARAIQ